MLVREQEGFVIYVNRKYTVRSPQWNAVCAHEIGHVLLSQACEQAVDRSNNWVDEDEYLADLAARELLLPAPDFRRLVGTSNKERTSLDLLSSPGSAGKVSLVLLAGLAEVFRAPLQMTARRLVETGIWRDLILEWRKIRDDLELISWWPVDHQAASILRAHTTASSLFGSGSGLHQALYEHREVERLENVVPAKSLFWFIRSAPFAYRGATSVFSFVMTPESSSHQGWALNT